MPYFDSTYINYVFTKFLSLGTGMTISEYFWTFFNPLKRILIEFANILL